MRKRARLFNNFALKKCLNGIYTGEDRISQLPDEIIVYILSFLSVKEAADTSVLSRRWLRLWRCILRLDFDASKQLRKVADRPELRKRQKKKYVRWVNDTLKMSETQRLEQFRVCFDLNKFSRHELDDWLAFAFARDVQRLELDLLKGGFYIRDFDYCYTFPERLIGLSDSASSSSGQSRSNDFHILPLVLQNFKSVKVLHLKSVNVTGEVLEFFLHNCPFLEQMVVHGSGTLVNLEVVGPSLKLKHLEIWYCYKVKSLKICDTNLVTLGTSAGTKLLLKNVPKLIEVEISGIPYPHIFKDISSVLSCVLFQLEVLKIHAIWSLENLEHYDFPELTKLRKFVVVSHEWEDPYLLSYTAVMRAAPQLKEVELQLKWQMPSTEKWTERECRKARSCPLHHLRVVKLCGYCGCTSEVELISFFLENAMALQKIIIDPRFRIFPFLPPGPKEIEREQTGRNLAKLQLEGVVNSDIEFVIL